MKKISLFLVLLILICSFSACGKSGEDTEIEAPEGTVAVTNDAVHFIAFYPKEWECDKNDGMITVSPMGDSGTKASISVRESQALEGEVAPKEYWEEAKKELETLGYECAFDTGKETTLGGEPAWRAEYGIKVGENTYKVTQVFAYKRIDSTDRMFTVTFVGNEKDYDDENITGAFKTVTENFSFKDE